MKCNKCDNDGTIEIIINIGDVEKKLNLCFDCYSRIINEHAENNTDLENFKFFDDVLSDLLGSVIEQKVVSQNKSTKPCPKCHTHLEDIVDSGKFGCEYCYTAFYDEIVEILKSTHGSYKHLGIHPERFEKIIQFQKRILEKKIELEDLVLKEEFELAASLRDEIEKLSEELIAIEGAENE